jgi:outer membrane protein OmpA-like peptidoglycan-associated protein
VQTAFQQLGLLKAAAPLKNPAWDYTQLATGLTKADVTGLASAGKPKFDKVKVQAKVEQEISVELATYEEASALPPFEIYFKPDQNEFKAADYLADFKQVLDQSQTASGMVFIIEGNATPDGYNKKKRDGATTGELEEIKQVAKNLSKKRADAVKTAILTFCSNEGVTCDESQFVTIGRGIEAPKFSVVKTREQWEQNRRVVFRPKFVTDVNVELDEFVPGQ